MKTLAAVMNPIAATALSAISIHALEALVRFGKSGIIVTKFHG